MLYYVVLIHCNYIYPWKYSILLNISYEKVTQGHYVEQIVIDKFSRDVMYRGIHEILPVNILIFKYNISKTHTCAYCNEVETLRDLFFNVLLTHNYYY
jgi:hypothetical protein